MKSKEILWKPAPASVQNSLVSKFINRINLKHNSNISNYTQLHRWSVSNSELFWHELAIFCELKFSTQGQIIFSPTQENMRGKWFKGYTLNYAENLLKYSSQRPNQEALIFYSETGFSSSIRYNELVEMVSKVMAYLRKNGVKKGDVVGALMSNQPETVIIMLATTALGAIFTSCSPDFGISAICDRFVQAKVSILFATEQYFYNGKLFYLADKIKLLEQNLSTHLKRVVMVPYPDKLSYNTKPAAQISTTKEVLHWSQILAEYSAEPPEFVPVDFDDPAFILYSSGTTGKPKCIVHSAGGTLLQHLKEHQLHCDIKKEDKLFYFTTCGWMMWNWAVSGLASGATILLFDGSPTFPNIQTLWNIIENEGVTCFGTSARYLATLETSNFHINFATLTKLKCILSTGSPLAASTFRYVYKNIKQDIQLSSISGGTDIISCFVLGSPVLPVSSGEIQCVGLGLEVAFLDSEGKSILDQKGELVCKNAFPSMPLYFLNDESGERYFNSYFSQNPGFWTHGDYGQLNFDGTVVIYGRSDTVLNPSGVRIGTAEIYAVLQYFDVIIEALAIGYNFENDDKIVLFLVLRPNVKLTNEIKKMIRTRLRKELSPRHVPAVILTALEIPKTFNGKIAELSAKQAILGNTVSNENALANPKCLDFFKYEVEKLILKGLKNV